MSILYISVVPLAKLTTSKTNSQRRGDVRTVLLK